MNIGDCQLNTNKSNNDYVAILARDVFARYHMNHLRLNLIVINKIWQNKFAVNFST